MEPGEDPTKIRVTPDEVARAQPTAPLRPPVPPRPPRTSQLAVAALVLALLGVPLPGCIFGPAAILFGALALAAIQDRDDLRGFRLAVAGLSLGAFVLVGWLIALWFILGAVPDDRPSQVPPLVPGPGMPAVDIEGAPAHIQRAIRANVRIRALVGGREVLTGSGVIAGTAADRVLILTNRHVVVPDEGTASLAVRFSGGEETVGRLLWTAPDRIDAAVVEARPSDEEGFDGVPLGTGPGAAVGDAVFAVGNPLGYEATYTVGVISAVRSLGTGSDAIRIYQTQAAVNPGNSGGGLYDEAGVLLGINTWTADKTIAEGIAFAISAASIWDVLSRENPPWCGEIVREERQGRSQ